MLTGYCTPVKGERANEAAGPRRKGKRKERRLGGLSTAYDRACEYRMPWESAISTWYPAGYEVVLITSRSPTMRVVPPLPMNWALFVFQLPAVRDAKAMLLTTVFAPPPVVTVSLTADVVRPVGVVVINSVQRSEERRVGKERRIR